jgi:hypothetical protein
MVQVLIVAAMVAPVASAAPETPAFAGGRRPTCTTLPPGTDGKVYSLDDGKEIPRCTQKQRREMKVAEQKRRRKFKTCMRKHDRLEGKLKRAKESRARVLGRRNPSQRSINRAAEKVSAASRELLHAPSCSQWSGWS